MVVEPHIGIRVVLKVQVGSRSATVQSRAGHFQPILVITEPGAAYEPSGGYIAVDKSSQSGECYYYIRECNYYIRPTGSIRPRLYDLPKVH